MHPRLAKGFLTVSSLQRDLLADLSKKRISITEIKFIGESPHDGGAYSDVVVATFVSTGSTEKEGRRVAVKKIRFVLNGDMTEEKFLRVGPPAYRCLST